MNAQMKILVNFKRNCDQLYTPKVEGELEGTHSWVQLPSWCWRAKQSCKMTCWILKCSFTRKVHPLTKWDVLEWTYMLRGERTPNLVIQITWASRDDPPPLTYWGGGWLIDLIFKGEKGWEEKTELAAIFSLEKEWIKLCPCSSQPQIVHLLPTCFWGELKRLNSRN